jgi:hypothetical protein
MKPRLECRHQEQRIAGCQVPTTLFRGAFGRLKVCAPPFVTSRPGSESRNHSCTYLAGLLSDVARKNAESIADRYALDRQVIQRFLGAVDWDHDALVGEPTRQVSRTIGRPDGVLVFDPSAFAKQGNKPRSIATASRYGT